ncbi:MAG: UvrD-helicase domain-containing protein [Chlamydiota bacterium]
MDLNPQQQQAVDHVEGPMLVLAGAGSGKTRVVIERIARLLHLGILPSKILAVTFTNKAAEEMSLRLEKRGSEGVLTTTFHSLGARILRESISHLGYQTPFTIYDEEDSLKLLKSCLQGMQIREEKGLLKKIRSLISQAKNRLFGPESSELANLSEERSSLLPRLYQAYQRALKEANAVDFDDLLFLTVHLLSEKKSVRTLYQDRWDFLLIDEYQDTNYVQDRLAHILSEKQGNLFAVGDPDQSIYSWRGALVDNILRFEEHFPGTTVVPLEENYRSSQEILQAAGALISCNERRYEKRLWSARKGEEKVALFQAKTDREEAEFVVDKVQQITKERSIPLHEVAIFYRTNAQSRQLEDALRRTNLPYQIVGGLSFYQRKEIKDLIALLRLLLSPADRVAFTRTINIPKRGIGLTSIKKILDAASARGQPPLLFLQEEQKNPVLSLSSKQKKGIQEYLEAFSKLRALLEKKAAVSKILEEAYHTFCYDRFLREDPDTYQDRSENIASLIAKAAEWESTAPSPLLEAFLEDISLSPPPDDSPASSIRLMTLHNAKGLEFFLVFIVGIEENILPHIYGAGESVEEERRLLYVGITRARHLLYLSFAKERYLWGTHKRQNPSRFLQDIPQDLLRKAHTKQRNDSSSDEFSFNEGDWVWHPRFGRGIIERAYHTSYGPTYDVYFSESDQERSLVAKYALLQSAK